jgi:hypothetical protein
MPIVEVGTFYQCATGFLALATRRGHGPELEAAPGPNCKMVGIVETSNRIRCKDKGILSLQIFVACRDAARILGLA